MAVTWSLDKVKALLTYYSEAASRNLRAIHAELSKNSRFSCAQSSMFVQHAYNNNKKTLSREMSVWWRKICLRD